MQFISTEEYKKSKRIAIYLSMQDEVITDGVMKVSACSDQTEETVAERAVAKDVHSFSAEHL